MDGQELKNITWPMINKQESEAYAKQYKTIKRWTKSVDVFEKDYLFVPIHNQLHWSLVLVVRPTPPPLLFRLDEGALEGGAWLSVGVHGYRECCNRWAKREMCPFWFWLVVQAACATRLFFSTCFDEGHLKDEPAGHPPVE